MADYLQNFGAVKGYPSILLGTWLEPRTSLLINLFIASLRGRVLMMNHPSAATQCLGLGLPRNTETLDGFITHLLSWLLTGSGR